MKLFFKKLKTEKAHQLSTLASEKLMSSKPRQEMPKNLSSTASPAKKQFLNPRR